MTRGARIGMMIIVPPVSKRKERNEDIVSALVRTFEPPRPEKMADRVRAVNGVVNEYSADEEPPRQHLQT